MRKKDFSSENYWKNTKKFLIVMKLTTLLIFVTTVQMSAMLFSQETKINLELHDGTIADVFSEIEKQSDFRIFYNLKQIDLTQKIDYLAQSKPISNVLDDVLSNLHVSFELYDKVIVIVPSDLSQDLKVTGIVTDAATGEILPGVNVLIEGTNTGVVTDGNGAYSIELSSLSKVLIFSYVGYTTERIEVEGKSRINVALNPDIRSLEEVVVIGYGTQSRKSVTGSMANVKAEDMNSVNAVSIDNMLQGKAAGLNISAITAQPGGNLTINIRGALSPNSETNSPLYVIDGVPITNNSQIDEMFGNGQTTFWGGTNRNPLNTINPNDIESVDILKDASAAAIYGSAAANGVILITTKRGKDQKTTVSYSGTYSFQRPKNYLKPLNSTDFMKYHELYGEEYWKYTNKIEPYGSTDPSTVIAYNPLFTAQDIANAGNGTNTNWVDYLMQDGLINDQNISITGGSESTKVFSSFNYLNQKALLRKTELNRYSGRLNLDQKIGSRLLLKLGFSYSHIKNQNENTGNQRDPDSPSPMQSALRYAPTFEVFDENGNLTHSYLIRTPNPHSWLMIKNNTTTTRIFITPSLDVKITDALKATVVAGIDQSRGDYDFYIPVSAAFQTVLLGDAQLATQSIGNYNAEGYLSYDKALGESRLSIVAGAGYYKTDANNYGLEGIDFFTDAFNTAQVSIAANKDKNTITSGRSQATKISQFIRVNYILRDRYIITFNGRNDGSSIWAEGHKWGFFPGLSAAWVISQESFLKSSSSINHLKLRAGYGTVGNEGMQGNFSLSTYGTHDNYYKFPFGGKMSPGVLQTQLGNAEIHWEKDITINGGLDFSFFNNRISGSIDYFVRTAKDLFNYRYLPSNNAIARIGANVGSTRSKGYEILIRTKNFDKNDFRWSTNLTFSSYKAFWVERSNPEDLAKTPWIRENDEINAVYGWKTDGIIKSIEEIPDYQAGAYVGNTKYIDVNKDGKLDGLDVQYLGNRDPKAFYGIGNTLEYKGFDLNIFFYGTLGGLQVDNWQLIGRIGQSVGLYYPAPSNAESHALNTWATFNPDGKYPGIAPDIVGDANNPTQYNDQGVRNVNWGRLKSVTLGYSLPSDLLRKSKLVQSIRLYVDMQNLAVFGNYSGLDPEMELDSNFPYPIARTTSFGLTVKF